MPARQLRSPRDSSRLSPEVQAGLMIKLRTVVILATLGVAVIATLAQSNSVSSGSPAAGSTVNQGQGAAAQSQNTTSSPSKPDGDYVGSDTCKGCHEDQSRRFN